MKKIITAAVAIAITLAGTASAGTVDNTLINYVRATGDAFHFVVATNVSGAPSCSDHSSGGRSFVVDLTSDGGKEIARIVTAAFLAGRQIKVVGTGACSLHGNKETTTDVTLK